MRSYPKYKSSGVEWLGEIPEHWDRYRMKFLFNSINGGVWGEEPVDNQNDMICIRVADFDYDNGVINLNKLTTRNISFSEQKGRILKKGDLLIEKSGGGELSPVGRVVKFDLDIKAVCSNFINRLNTKNTFSPDFLNCLNKFLYAKGLTEICINQTIGIQNLKVGEFLGKTVFVPPIDEQHKIVNFLDYKTGQCDRFISNRQKQIELLNEQKATIINKAVTKGINPNAKMKPSDIEWIGDIPEHWKVKRPASFGRFSKGSGISKSDLVENGVPVILYGDIYTKYNLIAEHIFNFISQELASNSKPIYKGDLLFTGSGETREDIGKCIVYNGETKAYAGGDLMIFRQKSNSSLFLAYSFSTNYAITKKAMNSRGDIIIHIYASALRDIYIPIPSLSEQQGIIDFIKKETSKIETLISKYQKQIELMQEYRTTLISQAVTGKIDVRDWKPPTK